MDDRRSSTLFPLMLHAGAVAVVGQTLLVRELMVSFYGTEFALAAALTCWLVFVPLGALAAGALLRAVGRQWWMIWVASVGLGLALPVQFFVARLIRPILGAQSAQFLSLPAMMLSGAVAAGPVSFLVGFLFPSACRLEGGRRGAAAGAIGRLYIAEALGSCAAGAALSLILLSRQAPTSIALLSGGLWLFASGFWLATWDQDAGRHGLWLLAAAAAWLAAGATGGRTGAALFASLLCLFACGGLLRLVRLPRLSTARRVATAACLGLALLAGVVFLFWGSGLRRWSLRARWRTFSENRLLRSWESRYQHLDLGYAEGQYVVFQNGQRGAVFPDEEMHRRSAVLLLTQHPQPERILVIGGGLGGLCQQLIEAGPFQVDFVEMDPALISFYGEYLSDRLTRALASKRFAAYTCDGRYFVQKVSRDPRRLRRYAVRSAGFSGRRHPAAPYDIVLVNLGDPASASANRFYTVGFFREVSRVLRPGGVLALWGISGDENYLAGPLLAVGEGEEEARGPVIQYTACLYKTLRRVFPQVVVRPGGEFRFFAGREGGPTAEPAALVERFEQLDLAPAHLRYMLQKEQFPPERVRYVQGQLARAAAHVAVNTDRRPVGFTLFLRLQDYYARRARAGAPGADVGGFFGFVLSFRAGWIVLPFGACLVLLLALRAVRGAGRTAPWACGLAIVTSGMFGLSSEVLIIYGYQTLFGYVYRDVSIIVGLFMLGLSGGAWACGRWGRSAPWRVLVVLESLQAVLLLALPALMAILSGSGYLFVLLSLVAGLLTGGEFPLACRVAIGQGREPGTVAAVFDAADHVGGALGAALTGLVLMPACGLAAGAALVACVKCASLLGLAALWVSPRR